MIELHHVDCMEFMAGLPDKSYDLCICDPPYGIGIDGQEECRKTNRIAHVFKGWDVEIPSAEYFKELRRVSHHQIIWGGNYMVEHLSASPCWLIWDKMQEFSGAVFEMAWTSFDTPAKAFRMSRVEAYTHQVKIHPTQKPVALYRWLLKNYAKTGQKILDTHGGSMSIAIACDIEGFDLTLCEIDRDYFEAGKKRLEQHQSAPRLFAPEPVAPARQTSIEDQAA